MKSMWKNSLKTLALMVVLAGSLTACQKKEDEKAFTKGTMSTDGINVVSNTNLGGYPLSMGLANVGGAGPATQQYNGYTISSQMIAINSYKFDLYINGTTKTLVTTPYVYNPAWSAYGYSIQNALSTEYIGGYQVFYESRCNSQACENLYINVVITSQLGQKQFGIRKDNPANTVFNMIEHDSFTNTIRPMEILINELNIK